MTRRKDPHSFDAAVVHVRVRMSQSGTLLHQSISDTAATLTRSATILGGLVYRGCTGYVAAHDLRSPLNAALNVTQLLRRRLEGRLDNEELSLFEMSIDSMRRLGTLMQDILTYSEVEKTHSSHPVAPLQDALNVALSNLGHHIEESNAIITVGSLPSVPFDRTRMAMVFQNLLGNALKYQRPEPPRIAIAVEKEGDHWRISVQDNGQGFKPEYAEQIFQRFKRLHGQNVTGSGIDLAICKRIVERDGGRIWAESTPGVGSTFYFTIPAGLG